MRCAGLSPLTAVPGGPITPDEQAQDFLILIEVRSVLSILEAWPTFPSRGHGGAESTPS
jgi:hypothetical protein